MPVSGFSVDNRIRLAAMSSIYNSQNFTITFWFKVGVENYGALLFFAKNGVIDKGMSIQGIAAAGPARRIGFFYNPNGTGIATEILTSTFEVHDGVYRHAAIIRTGDTFALYLNGVFDIAILGKNPGVDSNFDLPTVGLKDTGAVRAEPYLGDISHLRMYDRTLSPAELLADMANPTDLSLGPKFLYHLSCSNPAEDIGPAKANGVVLGTLTATCDPHKFEPGYVNPRKVVFEELPRVMEYEMDSRIQLFPYDPRRASREVQFLREPREAVAQ